MMESYNIGQVCISLLALGAVYHFFIVPQRAESCRSEIGRVRDDLFDFMWKGGHDFSDPAYQETRQMMNGLLRLTSVVGPFYFFAMIARCSSDQTRRPAIDALPDDDFARFMRTASARSIKIFLRFLYLEGCLGMCIKCICVVFHAVRLMQKCTEYVTSRADLLREMASEFGAENLAPRQVMLLKCRT